MAFADPSFNIEELSLDPGMKVVDVGSGSGHYALAAAKVVGEGGKVYAVDIQQELLSRLKREAAHGKIHNIETVWGDADTAQGLKLADASMDAAIVSNTLFLSEHKDQFAAEVLRVLKPRRRLLLIDWTDSFGGLGPHKDHVVPSAKAIALFSRQGAKLVREFKAGAHHYGLLFQKS